MSEQTRLKTAVAACFAPAGADPIRHLLVLVGTPGVPGARVAIASGALDPLTADPDEFAESPVELTVVDGTVSHRGRTAA